MNTNPNDFCSVLVPDFLMLLNYAVGIMFSNFHLTKFLQEVSNH